MNYQYNPNYYPNYAQAYPQNYGQFGGMNNQPINQPTVETHTTPALTGRFVNDFNDIKPDEIPMNGTKAIFIKNDLSSVCVKSWSANGTIDTSSYELKEEKPTALFNNIDYEILEDKLNKMDTLFSKRLDRLEKIVKRSEDE